MNGMTGNVSCFDLCVYKNWQGPCKLVHMISNWQNPCTHVSCQSEQTGETHAPMNACRVDGVPPCVLCACPCLWVPPLRFLCQVLPKIQHCVLYSCLAEKANSVLSRVLSADSKKMASPMHTPSCMHTDHCQLHPAAWPGP